ncbi:hypothetical protein ACHAXT_009580 [Thalassiosira profunda]
MNPSTIHDTLTKDTAAAAESLAAMLQKEEGYACQDYLNPARFACGSIKATEADRVRIVDWCYTIVDHCRFRRETVAIAMEMVDRFLSSDDGAAQRILRNRKQLQLAAVAALYVAIKTSEQVAIGSAAFAALCHGAYSADEIEAMELTLLQGLSWRLCAPTSLSFAHHVLSLVLPRVSLAESTWEFILDEVQFQTEHAARSYFFTTQRSSTAAMAAIFNTLDQVEKEERQAVLNALMSVVTESFDSPQDMLDARNQLMFLVNGSSDEDSVMSETSKEVQAWTTKGGEKCYDDSKAAESAVFNCSVMDAHRNESIPIDDEHLNNERNPDGTWCLYYVPLAFGRAMTRALKKIEAAGAEAEKEDFMVLSDCHSPWQSDVFVSVAPDKEVEGALIEKISGDFLSKAFKGDYSNIGKWMKEMRVLVKDVLEERGRDVDAGAVRYLFYYPTCPKCAKKHGENHVVIMAKLD